MQINWWSVIYLFALVGGAGLVSYTDIYNWVAYVIGFLVFGAIYFVESIDITTTEENNGGKE